MHHPTFQTFETHSELSLRLGSFRPPIRITAALYSMRSFPLFLVFAASLALAHGLDNGLELSPAMGYSSWNDCASEVTEKRIRQVTKNFIDTGLAAKGFVHINIDEGWLLKRNATTGALVEDRVKFPSGMKALGAWVHDQVVPGKGKGSGCVQAGGAPPRAVVV